MSKVRVMQNRRRYARSSPSAPQFEAKQGDVIDLDDETIDLYGEVFFKRVGDEPVGDAPAKPKSKASRSKRG